MGGFKLATPLAITMIVLIAFTSTGTVAQEFGAAPAPSPSMENAGMALQVPALLAAIVSLAACTSVVESREGSGSGKNEEKRIKDLSNKFKHDNEDVNNKIPPSTV
ncbi:hypothetical protein L1887_37924 [Cichorium endivia]|nr:hypothetical protein L1887_37924 [Cichorium endivia]